MAGRPKLMVAVTGYPNPYPKSQVFKKLNTTIENAVKPFAIGSGGRFVDPAAIGILIQKSQTTVGMGIHPNDDGHSCISDVVFEADTLEPGITLLKWKLGIPEAPNSNICQ